MEFLFAQSHLISLDQNQIWYQLSGNYYQKQREAHFSSAPDNQCFNFTGQVMQKLSKVSRSSKMAH